MSHLAHLDTSRQISYDSGTTTSNSGYPHPLSGGIFIPSIHPHSFYDGSREPNTIPLVGNTLRRLLAVVEARRPMPTKHRATYPTNLTGKAMNTQFPTTRLSEKDYQPIKWLVWYISDGMHFKKSAQTAIVEAICHFQTEATAYGTQNRYAIHQIDKLGV